MSFSSKIEKPLQPYSVISPSFTVQRRSLAVPENLPKKGETALKPLPLQRQMEQAAGLGHHLSNINITSSPATVQTKLTIGQPGDRYEQEADQVAQQVMTMPDAKTVQRESAAEEELQTKPLVQRQEEPKEEEELKMKPLASRITPVVQRQEMPEEEETAQMKPEIQREMQPEEEEEQVQTKSTGEQSGAMDSSNLEQQLSSSKGGGTPLGDDVRSFMEPRFGADFSQVKIHNDSSANQMNQSIQAQAFTHGKDIYFNAGKYSPSTDEGKSLLAHELTHVVQQTGER